MVHEGRRERRRGGREKRRGYKERKRLDLDAVATASNFAGELVDVVDLPPPAAFSLLDSVYALVGDARIGQPTRFPIHSGIHRNRRRYGGPLCARPAGIDQQRDSSPRASPLVVPGRYYAPDASPRWTGLRCPSPSRRRARAPAPADRRYIPRGQCVPTPLAYCTQFLELPDPGRPCECNHCGYRTSEERAAGGRASEHSRPTSAPLAASRVPRPRRHAPIIGWPPCHLLPLPFLCQPSLAPFRRGRSHSPRRHLSARRCRAAPPCDNVTDTLQSAARSNAFARRHRGPYRSRALPRPPLRNSDDHFAASPDQGPHIAFQGLSFWIFLSLLRSPLCIMRPMIIPYGGEVTICVSITFLLLEQPFFRFVATLVCDAHA